MASEPTRLLSSFDLDSRISACPKLASLGSINSALKSLVHSDRSETSQIAAIIRQDPSLTTRVLRLVNSVYFGLATKVNNIEEAVLFLGTRNIRELSAATPVIEELQKLHTDWPDVPWREHWRHSIGTAIMTREVLSATGISIDDETDYIIGLLHNVGKVVIANTFPAEFAEFLKSSPLSPADANDIEREILGADHAEIGARYLERQRLPDEIVESIRYHHDPASAPNHQLLAAAIQLADSLVRHAGITEGLNGTVPPDPRPWTDLPAWPILFGHDEEEAKIANASLIHHVKRLPSIVNGIL